jgi:flavin-dependent dehydrogenase
MENTNLLPGIQVTLPLVKPLQHTKIYFEPGIHAGYGWLFPKNEVANVGLGLKTEGTGVSLRKALDDFVARLVAEGLVINEPQASAGGWIPAERVRSAVSGKCILVGDAAGHTHPITGAGIFTAVNCGESAGEHAAEAALSGDLSILKEYDEDWKDMFEDTLSRAFKRRELMEERWDEFDDIIRSCWVAYREYYA